MNFFFFHDGISAIRKPFLTNSFFFHDGTSAITELFSRILSFFTMELRLSRSLSHKFFLFSRWNFGYHGAFLTNSFFFHDGTLAITEPFSRIVSFFTMELWLSRSLSHKFFLFSRWNFGYHGAFLTNSLFFHDGISAIKEPFSRILSFFTMELRLSRSLSHEFFIFSRWNFETQNTKRAIWGKTLFIYISERVFT
jgi:hypothetical protein